MNSQSQLLSPRGGVGFSDGGDKDVADEGNTFRRRSQMVKDGSQPEGTRSHAEITTSRRNSVGETPGKAPGEKAKDDPVSAKDRRRSVRTHHAGNSHHHHHSSHAARKHHAVRTPAHDHGGNASFGKVMDQSAKRINAAVHSLYRAVPKKVEEPGGRKGSKKRAARQPSHDRGAHAAGESEVTQDKARRQSLLVNDELTLHAVKAESSSDSDSSDSDDGGGGKKDQDDDVLSEDSGSDDYDFKQAALKVNHLLDSLNSETRTNIMSDLNNWYASRKQGVEDDLADLSSLDTEHQLREEETKTSMASMLQNFEDKQMREVKVLVKCNRTLNLGARRKLKRRARFAKKNKKADSDMEDTLKALDKKEKRKAGPRTAKGGKRKSKKDKDVKVQDSEDGESQRRQTARKSDISDAGGTWETADSDHSGSDDESEDDDEAGDSEQDSEDDAEGKRASMQDSPDSMRGEESNDMPICIEDGLDVEAARRKLKEMHDVPQRVMAQMNSDEPPAADILNALATVQEGQLQLEIRAKLARKACDISKSALDHITEGHPPEEADDAVKNLIEEVRVQVFGENGDGLAAGPDPEELEEECRALEQLIAKQEKDIEAYNKIRERSLRLEQDMADHMKENDSDDGGDDGHAQPTLLKSELRDGRLEAAQHQRSNANMNQSPRAKSTVTRVKNAIKMTRSKTKEVGEEGVGAAALAGDSSPRGDFVQTLSNAGPTVPSWQSNRQIQLLQEKISEKEAKIAKAKEVHKRMKKELALLRYCAQKSEAGLDALLEDFDPSNIGGDSETSDSDSDHPRDRISGNSSRGHSSAGSPNRKSTLSVPGQGSHAADPRGHSNRGSVVVSAPVPGSGGSSPRDQKRMSRRNTAKRGSNMVIQEAPANKSGKSPRSAPEPSEEPATRERHRKFDDKFTKEVQAFNNKKLEEAEAEMKARISELQVQITRDVYNLKSEKKRQNILKKDIKRLKKSYQSMVKKHKGAPNSLEALDSQMKTLAEGETKLKTQIKELNEELNRQQRMLERAQAEAEDNEQKRKEQANQASPMTLAAGVTAGLTTGLMGGFNSTIGGMSSPAAGASAGASAAAAAGTAAAPAAAAATALGRRASGTAADGAQGLATSHVNASGIRAEAEAAAQVSRQLGEAGYGALPPPAPTPGLPSPTGASSAAPAAATALGVAVTAPDATGALALPVHEPAVGEAATPSSGLSPSGVAAPGLASPTAPGASAPASARSSMSKTQTGSTLPTTPKAAPDKPLSAAKPEESKPSTQGVGHEDLAELVRLQSRNEEFKQEIEETMKKMQQLRLAMKKGKAVSSDAIREIVGANMSAEETKPPPEYFSLKKEVRVKQNEVRGLRKRWWSDHKDLDALVEKVRHTHGIHEHHGSVAHQSFAHRPDHHVHDADARPDINHMEPLRRKLVEVQQDHHRSSVHHSTMSFSLGHTEQDHEAAVVGHAPGHHGGQRHSVKPLALGSLAAFRPVEAGVATRYRLSSELNRAHYQEPLSPIGGITGKTFSSRQSVKVDDPEELSPIRKRSLMVRKSLVPEAAHSLTELVSGVEDG
mmetsp:Transcript_90505/g.156906  ORF Transcript_90505/g.156906 Transcript_90505/m.156906 type:complete len:1556 (+) Transcript_90505:120-4787(+)